MTKVLTADDSWTDWLCVLKVIDGKAYPIGLVKSLDLKARTCQRLRYHGPSLGEEVGEVNGIALEEFGYDYVVLNKDTAPEWAWDEAEKHGVPVMTTDEFKALVEEFDRKRLDLTPFSDKAPARYGTVDDAGYGLA